jgi:hypothetical protein
VSAYEKAIIRKVRRMNIRELLDLLIENPFFLTDAYYVETGKAVRDRYAELKGDFLVYYSE